MTTKKKNERIRILVRPPSVMTPRRAQAVTDQALSTTRWGAGAAFVAAESVRRRTVRPNTT